MEEVKLQAMLSNIEVSLAGLYSQQKESSEERGREVVEEIDALARSSGGAAEFISVHGNIVNYRLTLPPAVAAGFLAEWEKLDAAPIAGK